MKMTQQEMKKEISKIVASHRLTCTDSEWLTYGYNVGFFNLPETDKEIIIAAVEYDAAESGLMPAWYYTKEYEG